MDWNSPITNHDFDPPLKLNSFFKRSAKMVGGSEKHQNSCVFEKSSNKVVKITAEVHCIVGLITSCFVPPPSFILIMAGSQVLKPDYLKWQENLAVQVSRHFYVRKIFLLTIGNAYYVRYLLAADTKTDRATWIDSLNEALRDGRAWTMTEDRPLYPDLSRLHNQDVYMCSKDTK